MLAGRDFEKGNGRAWHYCENDDRDNVRSGFKFAEHELKGVPVRLAMGPRDYQNGTVEVARRDTLEKQTISQEGIADYIANLLEEIQVNIFKKALKFREENTHKVDTYEEFKQKIEEGGFILAHWDGTFGDGTEN